MSVLVVVSVILLVAVGLLALLSTPWGLSSGAALKGAAIPPESAETKSRLAALAPPSSAIIGALPALPGGANLKAMSPIEPPPVDLSTIGCGEDKEETDAAVWREVRRALAQRSGQAPPPGGR